MRRCFTPMAQEAMCNGIYSRRSSPVCSRRYCGYWRECELIKNYISFGNQTVILIATAPNGAKCQEWEGEDRERTPNGLVRIWGEPHMPMGECRGTGSTDKRLDATIGRFDCRKPCEAT